ncbi:MAG TPA: hypothetical protein VGB96_00475, partial [Archangium sp.]
VGYARRAGEPGRMERGVAVSIYATVGGKLVTQIERGGARVAAHAAAPARVPTAAHTEPRVGIHDSPEAAYAWLVADNGGKLGPVSKEAWVAACRAWPPLAPHAVEVIE